MKLIVSFFSSFCQVTCSVHINILHSALLQLCQFKYIILGQKPSCHYLLRSLTFLNLSILVYETGGQNFYFVKQSRKSICSVVIVRTTCFNI